MLLSCITFPKDVGNSTLLLNSGVKTSKNIVIMTHFNSGDFEAQVSNMQVFKSGIFRSPASEVRWEKREGRKFFVAIKWLFGTFMLGNL